MQMLSESHELCMMSNRAVWRAYYVCGLSQPPPREGHLRAYCKHATTLAKCICNLRDIHRC